MKNLAGANDCDRYIEQELRRCGIEAVRVERTNTKVPYTIMGKFGDFVFIRGWSYWVVKGNMPLAIAQELYADEVGKTDVRVVGNCGCPPPEGVWVTYIDENGVKLFPSSKKPVNDPNLVAAVERSGEYRFVDDPATSGQAVIDSYHIDTEVGLRFFADTLKRHTAALTTGKWKLQGYDTFEGGDAYYPLDGEYGSEVEAKEAARARLVELEKSQPRASSGGQHGGIQDQVYIVSPNGKRRRFLS